MAAFQLKYGRWILKVGKRKSYVTIGRWILKSLGD